MSSAGQSFAKKRKLQLDSMQCQNHMASVEGSASLTNPTQAASSSAKASDPNKGLYPRKKKKKSKKQDALNNSSDEDTAQYNNSARNFNNNPNHRREFVNFQPASSVEFSKATCSNNDNLNVASSCDQNWKSRSNKQEKLIKATQKNNIFNYYDKDVSYKPKLPSVKFGVKDEGSKSSLSNVLNLGYKISPDSSPEHKPEMTPFVVEISNCQNMVNDTINISSDDDDEGDGFGFGLFGAAEIDFVNNYESTLLKNHFEKLPIEMMEMIFGHLPLQTLLMSASMVCQQWKTVINNKSFLTWRKKYYKLKSYPNECGKEMNRELTSYTRNEQMSRPETILFGLIKEMKIFEMKVKFNECMIEYLKNHPKYPGAYRIVTSQFSNIHRDLNPFCIIAALVILSETVDDIQLIFKLLINHKSKCHTNDILECFYYLATMFYYFVSKFQVAKGLHYRLFYSLYQYENMWSGSTKDITSAFQQNKVGQQSILRYGEGKLKMTNQQMKIINHQMEPNQIVKIVAFAGTGKTSTLVEYTKNRPSQRFLNIVFNKSVCDHAARTFPPNVECRTAHSLAFCGVKVKEVYKFARGSLKPKDLEKLDLIGPADFEGKSPNAIEKNKYRRGVLTTFENYINSADEFITIKHTPEYYNKDSDAMAAIHDTDRLNMITDAVYLWKKMVNPNDYEVQMQHDGYLKLHQLEKPIYSGYSCILIDEAQDCNPAMLSIILNQTAPKIFVGDPNQQIYAFRGAVNALASIQHTHIYYLTQSFRFGPEIAYIANTILYELKGVKSQTLVGGKQESSISNKRIGQLAVLSRSNSSLFKEAVRMICLRQFKSHEPTDIKGYFNGGTEGLKQLVDIYNLQLISIGKATREQAPVKDKFIQKFQTFAALRSYAIGAEDVDLKGKISLVEVYQEKIPVYVKQICETCRHNIKTANLVYSTVHKAKGMEFDSVVLTDDFSVLFYPYKSLPVFDETNQDAENELNILYVAVTRAKKCLIINSAVYFVLLGAGEMYEYPVLQSEEKAVQCSRCGGAYLIRKDSFVLKQNNLTLANGKVPIQGGVLCDVCADKEEFLEVIVSHPDNIILEIPPVDAYNHKLMRDLQNL